MSNYSCNSCNYSTNKNSNYSAHLKSVKHKINTGETVKTEKVHSCKECDKTFSRSDSLNRHMKTHSNSEMVHDYKCNLCNKTFRDKFNLRSHLSGSIHLAKAGEKVKSKLVELQTLEHMKDSEEFFRKKKAIRDEGKKGSCVKVKTTVARRSKSVKDKEEKPLVEVFDVAHLDNLLYTEHPIEELVPLITKLLSRMNDKTLKGVYLSDLSEFEEYEALNQLKEEVIDVLKDELE
jgi:hypothetical protein